MKKPVVLSEYRQKKAIAVVGKLDPKLAAALVRLGKAVDEFNEFIAEETGTVTSEG